MSVHDYDIDVIVHPEDIPIRGNAMASGDDDVDREVEDAIIADLANGNEWAWCTVEVRVSRECDTCGQTLSASAFLGACAYKGVDDFKLSGYYTDMILQAIEELE